MSVRPLNTRQIANNFLEHVMKSHPRPEDGACERCHEIVLGKERVKAERERPLLAIVNEFLEFPIGLDADHLRGWLTKRLERLRPARGPVYEGDASRDFWQRIRNLNSAAGDALYNEALRLQDLERVVLGKLDKAEAEEAARDQ